MWNRGGAGVVNRPMDISEPFRGSCAVQAGVLTRRVLAGPRFRRLFPDIYVPADLPVDFVLRSKAAARLVAPNGVLSGYSAAELLGASCGPKDPPAEVTVPVYRRPTGGLVVHRDRLDPYQVVAAQGVLLTSPQQTALDLIRWHDLLDGVVATDAIAHAYPHVTARVLRHMRSISPGAPGVRKLDAVLALMDRRAQSPMESRVRVALVRGGLAPSVQYPVAVGRRTFFLDVAFPEAKLAVEHNGRRHLDPEQALRDLAREAALAAAGWKIIRFSARIVLGNPEILVATTRAELRRRTLGATA